MINRLSRHKSTLLVLGFFGLLTFLALDNLLLHFGTAVPDAPYKDYAIFYWDLWWFRYALLNLHTDPLMTDYILHPNTVNLALHTHIFTLAAVSLPFQFFMDMRWIVNGLIALSFVLSATVMFVFLRRRVHNIWLAVLGAVLYAFGPGPLHRATEAHLHTLPLWWLPLCLLLWDLTLERRSVRRAVALGMCIYAAFMHYSEILLWILLTLSPYMLYGLIRQASWGARRQVIGLGLTAAAAALAPALIMPLPQLWQSRQAQYLWEEWRFVQALSFPITALVTRQPVAEGSTLGQTLPALVVLSLAFTGKRRERWLWLSIGLASLILALGPYWGDPSRPLPFMLLFNFLQGQYRTPVRLTTPATLALVIFVTLSLANFWDRLSNRRPGTILIALLIGVYCLDVGILAPFPIIFPPDYAVYHIIGTDSQDHTLLQVPLGPGVAMRGVPHPDAEQLAYYARFHHQRAINGVVSRAPAEQLELFRCSPFLLALAGEIPLPPFEAARAEFVQRLESWDIHYVVIHKDLLEAKRERTIIQFFNEQPELCVFYNDADTIAYQAVSPQGYCPRPDLSVILPGEKIDLGEAGDDRFVGRGWYDVENVGGPQARWAGEILTSTLRLALPPQNLHVRFRAAAYPTDQTVSIAVNRQPLARLSLSNDWTEYDLLLPAGMLPPGGASIITLTHARLESAFERTAGATPDHRPLAAAYDYFVFEPVR